MGLIDDCEKYFGVKNLYEVLDISKEASVAEVKKGYRKASLLCHPDRFPDKVEEATRKFQTLSKVHCILSDKEQRAVYDETGSIDEESGSLEDRDWNDYWRVVFPKITLSDIKKFMEKYKDSEEEREDLKSVYMKYEGDMNKISQVFIGYSADEEEKYAGILRDMIKKKEIPDYPNFSNEKQSKKDARIKRFKKEEQECDEIDPSLMQALAQRQERREDNFSKMMKNLEDKYCKKTTKTKKK